MKNLSKIRNQYIEAASAIFDVNPDSILQPNKGSPQESFARFYVYASLRDHNLSLTKIAHLMGRNHTSVLYGIRKYENAHHNPNNQFHYIIQSAIFDGKIDRIPDDKSF